MKIICRAVLLTLILSIFVSAQTQNREIRVTGRYTSGVGDTPVTAKQMALLDAKLRTLSQASLYVGSLDSINKLRLSDDQIDAYVMGLVEPQEQSSRTSINGGQTIHQVDTMAIVDTAKITRFADALRIDTESSTDLLELSKQARSVRDPVVERNRVRLEIHLLLAQATVALSKQDEGPTAARISTDENRRRARKLIETAVALDSENIAARYKMGDVLLVEGKAAEAEKEFRSALTRDAGSSVGHDKLGNALLKLNKYDDAAAEFREAIRINPKYVVAHSDLGLTLRSQRNMDAAIAEFKESIRIDPDYVDGHNNLAITLANQRQIPAAIAEFREIIRISPGSALGHYNASIALADMEEDMECIVELRKTIAINPNHFNAHYNLGEMLRLQGDLKESAHEFGEYVRLAPVTPTTEKGIEKAKGFIEAFKDE